MWNCGFLKYEMDFEAKLVLKGKLGLKESVGVEISCVTVSVKSSERLENRTHRKIRNKSNDVQRWCNTTFTGMHLSKMAVMTMTMKGMFYKLLTIKDKIPILGLTISVVK